MPVNHLQVWTTGSVCSCHAVCLYARHAFQKCSCFNYCMLQGLPLTILFIIDESADYFHD